MATPQSLFLHSPLGILGMHAHIPGVSLSHRVRDSNCSRLHGSSATAIMLTAVPFLFFFFSNLFAFIHCTSLQHTKWDFPSRVHCILSQSSTSTNMLFLANDLPFLVFCMFCFFPPSLVPYLLPSATSCSPPTLSLLSMFAFYTISPPHFIESPKTLINPNTLLANTCDTHISMSTSLTLHIL